MTPLKQGEDEWNSLRADPFLFYAMNSPDLSGKDLSGIRLNECHLENADLTAANLEGADLSCCYLQRAKLRGARLVNADLSGASLVETNFSLANLEGANLTVAQILLTVFASCRLNGVRGLESCVYLGPSIIDFKTLQLSGNLPLRFLQGCDLPDRLIDYLPILLEANQMYSCFISYSAKDEIFAQRLHADLQNKGIRCWFAPHDLSIGAKTLDAIDEAIEQQDKLLLILSKRSIASDWVEDEVSKAYAKERSLQQVVLFPVRIDDAVMKTSEPWAVKLRDQRNIGDFTKWTDPVAYQKSFDRVVRDLTVKPAGTP